MNERYLFRGKRIDNGEWARGHYVFWQDHIHTQGYHAIVFSDGEHMNEVKIDPATIGQCIGLRDKRGELIFEGDIVEDADGRTFSVEFSTHFLQTRLIPINKKALTTGGTSKKYGVEIFSWTYPEMDLTVIGNIHDNPELTEAE